MPPKISVLTSCFNAERFLREAIESILSQTFKDFEFILIDDGSNDNTLAIIKSYKSHDSRIVVISKKNTGLTDSLNVGLARARGEWIARMDADDISCPTRLEKQLKFINKNPDIILLGTSYFTINCDGLILKKYIHPREHKKIVRRIERSGPPFPHSSVLYRRKVVQQVGGYRGVLKYAQDCDLWLRICLVGQISCLREPLIHLRRHNGSITAQNSKPEIFSSAGRVAYYLRKNGYLDPLDLDENKSQIFLNWIEEKLNENGVFELGRYNSSVKDEWLSLTNRNILRKSLVMVARLACAQGFKLLESKAFGSKRAEKLAAEWVSVKSRHK